MTIKKVTFLFLFSLLVFQVLAQNPTTCYRLQLKDKHQSPYSVSRPEEFLSPRAISNKTRYNINITEQDLPVNPQYKQLICAVDNSVRILAESRWQNTVVVYCPDSVVLETIKNLPFIDTAVIPVASYMLENEENNCETVPANEENMLQNVLHFDSLYDYGPAWAQIAFHNGHKLHELGFYGDGMLIAVLDGGWEGFDTIPYFQAMYENGQLLGTRDLIPGHNNVYKDGTHGTCVTSIMAMAANGQMIGTAPHASYYFIMSESPFSEELIEEDFWAQGVEIADSLGADVVNSSLGYSTFPDFPQGDFTYESCDGVTSIASRNASLACHKGIVVCVAAGNEGNKPWHYISHPADAFDVISVGAARAVDSVMASFSSYGPSYDGRVKPDVTSVGWNTYMVNSAGEIKEGNGTSLASPMMAGLVACLRQALLHKSALEILDIVREHGHKYLTPDTAMGYGIPNMYQAYLDNAVSIKEAVLPDPSIMLYPNPCENELVIPNPDGSIRQVEIYDVSGKLIRRIDKCWYTLNQISVADLTPGFYIVRAKTDTNIKTAKIIKR